MKCLKWLIVHMYDFLIVLDVLTKEGHNLVVVLCACPLLSEQTTITESGQATTFFKSVGRVINSDA
jgi:hypothetical protein